MPRPECGDCARCPFVDQCRPKVATITSVTSRNIISSGESIIGKTFGKVVDFQAYRNFSGGPAPEVQKESRCTCGFCSECKKREAA